MLSYYERNFDYLELKLGCIPATHKINFSLEEHIVEKLEKGAAENTAVYKLRNDTAALHLHKVKVDKKRRLLTCLLHYTDKNISDPAFKHLRSGAVRTAKKETGEGIAVSAHLIILLEPILTSKDNAHLCVLETVPGIPKSLLEKAFNAYFNGLIKGNGWVKKGTNKAVRPSFSFSHLACDSLTSGLKTRRLTGVTLLSKSLDHNDDFDEDGLSIKESQVSFAVGESLTQELTKTMLHSISKKARARGYTTLKVRYYDTYQGTKTGTFHSLDEDTIERAAGVFSKRGRVYVEDKIEQCQDLIHHELSVKMQRSLLKEGGLGDAESDTEEAVEASKLPAYQTDTENLY
ncbi:hypothetical protein ACSTLH_13740 [Vibrio parahaemolyticus]